MAHTQYLISLFVATPNTNYCRFEHRQTMLSRDKILKLASVKSVILWKNFLRKGNF